jgi:sulfhydrogenase subunit beta (sulfur reductase)
MIEKLEFINKKKMSNQILAKEDFEEWVNQLSHHHCLIGPQRKQTEHIFAEIRVATDLDLDYRTTILPPKKLLLPQREEVFSFDDSRVLATRIDNKPVVLLGVHTCDLHAILLLDHIFNRQPADPWYQSRRKNLTLVSIECLYPCSAESFCKDMGTLVLPEEYDLHLIDLGEEYALDIGSSKGAALLNGFARTRPAKPSDHAHIQQIMSEKWPRFPYRIRTDISELPSLMTLSYNSPLWEELGERCLGCGSCTLVCPTCYCFDVLDDVDFSLKSGSRYRVWDSCQLNEFAVVAGGHDFRSGRAARLRHRFARKYKYIAAANDLPGCVGCGRCARACLAGISPVEVLNQFDKQRGTLAPKKVEKVML